MNADRLPVVVIAALGRNHVIGTGDRMPWRLPGELAHFRAETWGKPVIFGRRTLAAIGKPLPGRFCIVLSRDPHFHMAGAATARDLDDALAQARAAARRISAAEIMVAGGATVYAEALPLADELRLTWVDREPDGDAVFPPIDDMVWQEIERTTALPRPADKASYTFARYRRRDGR